MEILYLLQDYAFFLIPKEIPMDHKLLRTAAFGTLALSCLLLPATLTLAGDKPKVLKPCMQCHTDDSADTIRGKLGSVSMKASTLNVSTGSATWLVGFDEDTQLNGAEALNKIDTDHEISVIFEDEGDRLYAKSVSVKQPTALDPKQLITVDELAPLVEQGAPNVTIVDARPGKLFLESHIPGAISIYDAQFDKNIDKLPKDKDNLIVFYCGGPT